MTDTKDPKKPNNPRKIADGADGSYDERIRNLANVTDAQKAKMTFPQQMAVMNAKRALFEHNQKAKAESDALAQQRAQADIKASASREQSTPQQTSAKTSTGSGFIGVTPEITVGKVVGYALNPLDFKQSFRGFAYAAAILVQIFARIFISIRLIAPDHPARLSGGALKYGVFRLLEEARKNLLPLRAFQEKSTTGPFAGIQAIAVRQYTVFSAVIGVFITGFLAILMKIMQVVFGATYALAADTSSTITSGMAMVGCPDPSSFTSSGTLDYGSACLDGIFGTAAGSTASVVSSGLGTMLQMYSNMMLVFAGIIVLWIIISAVAETARTGVPFGKGFNSVWAPIRLVVALGLLVPLPSGLNSGQYIVVSVAKWGSQEATSLWNAYVQKAMTPTTGTQSPSGVQNVSFDNASNAAFARQMFQIALCEAVQNQTCNSEGPAGNGCSVSQVTIGQQTTPQQPTTNISSVKGSTPSTQLSADVPNQIAWFVPDATGKKPAAGYPNCGSVTLNLPSTTSTPSNQSVTNNPAATAAQSSVSSILQQQSNAAAALENSLQSVANETEDAANNITANGGTAPDQATVNKIYTDYQSALSTYLNAQQSNIQSTLSNYNNALTSSTASTQQFGWINAPVWLMNLVNANSAVSSAVNNLGKVDVPNIDPKDFTGGDTSATSTPQQDWPMVQQIFNASVPAGTTLIPSKQQQYNSKILNTLQQLTNTAAVNPLAQSGVYGRDLMVTGAFLIEPENIQDCLIPGKTIPEKDQAVCDQLTGKTSGTAVLKNIPSNSLTAQSNGGHEMHAMLYPIGMVMISMGFLLVMLTFLLVMRFILGILNWMISVFEAVLAVPLIALALLSTGGEGFSTQQFTADMWLLVGVVLRPVLMTIGTVLSITAFNNIMRITSILFAPSLATMSLTSDDTYLSLGIYVVVYSSLAYTLANSAFKLIDMLPNWVMNWIGARMESRVDDAGAVQQQASGYINTMAYARDSSPGRPGEQQTQQAANTGASAGGSNPSSVGGGGQQSTVGTTKPQNAANVGGGAQAAKQPNPNSTG